MNTKEQYKTTEAYYSTFFHEIAHSTGHETRLKRELKGVTQSVNNSYGKEEIIAELTSAFLCGFCEIEKETIKNSSRYIKGWLNNIKEDKKQLINAVRESEKAFNYIIENTKDELKECD